MFSSVLSTVFALKLVYDLPPMFIMSIPYCQTFIPMIIFVFVQRPSEALPAERDNAGIALPQGFGKTIYFTMRVAAICCLLFALAPVGLFLYLKYSISDEIYWMGCFFGFLIVSSGTHWINYAQFSWKWAKRFQPQAKKSCNEIFGMGVILSTSMFLNAF